MSIEIEAKYRLTKPEVLISKLGELGAPLDRELFEVNTYFDSAEGAFKSTDQGLRIRIETDDKDPGDRRVVITHKGPRSHGRLKSRSETELRVYDEHAAEQLLAVLGYREVLTFEKRRVRYLLDDCRIEIDTLPYLGTFVEIEGHSEAAVLAVRDKLDMADAPMIRASYIAMLVTHCREHAISATSIRFPRSTPAPDAASPPKR